MLDVGLLRFVEMNLDQTRTVQLYTRTFADDFRGKDQIRQYRIVNGR